MLIKERKRLFEKLVEAQRERSKAEMLLASAANKNSAGEGTSKRENFQLLFIFFTEPISTGLVEETEALSRKICK